MKNKLKKLIIPIFFILCGFIGFGMAYFIDSIYDIKNFTQFLLMLAVFYASYFLNIILHETGHMIGGLLSGYEFVSIRFGSLMIAKENGKLRRKKYSLPGTGGQCIMTPKSLENIENHPFLLYHLGGGIADLILCAIGFVIYALLPNGIAALCAFIFGITSLFVGAINLIPLNVGIYNDGRNVLEISKSKQTAKYINTLMYLTGLSCKGVSIEDMPPEALNFEIKIPENSFEANAMTILVAKEILKENFEKAEELCNLILECENLIELLKNEVTCEKLFCKLMTNAPREEIDKIYTKKLQTYVRNNAKYMLSKRRLQIAYYLYQKDLQKADKSKKEFDKLCENPPIAGDCIDEKKISDLVFKRLLNKEAV